MTKDITAGITFKTVKKKDNVTIEIDERLLSPKKQILFNFKRLKDLEAMNKRLSKDNLNLAKEIDRLKIKDSCRPNGWPAGKPWTEKDAAEAMEAAGLGLSRDDFSDDGADLQDLKEIMEGN
jgi:hypothetical protein